MNKAYNEFTKEKQPYSRGYLKPSSVNKSLYMIAQLISQILSIEQFFFSHTYWVIL